MLDGRILNARPDRLDFRDRMYFPPLRPLPERVPSDRFSAFWQWLIKITNEQQEFPDQQQEPSCTGHALANTIRFRSLRRFFASEILKVQNGSGDANVGSPDDSVHVAPSADMLYQLAKVYDDRAGEAYRGSSCRGAMKGWHHHGVLNDNDWQAVCKRGLEAAKDLIEHLPISEALRRPGAYYRIKVSDVDDVRAAILDADCVFASVQVHELWEELGVWDGSSNGAVHPDRIKKAFSENASREDKPFIPYKNNLHQLDARGGHAIALVGYDPDGFIILNSWGPKWGCQGFAWLGYDAWQAFAIDAWVAVEGAPMRVDSLSVGTNKDLSLLIRGSASNAIAGVVKDVNPLRGQSETECGYEGRHKKEDPKHLPWSEQITLLQTILMGLDGRILPRRMDIDTGHGFNDPKRENSGFTKIAQKTVERAVYSDPSRDLEDEIKDLVIVFGAGLESENRSVGHFGILGSKFAREGIGCLFVDWSQGLWPVIADQVILWSTEAMQVASQHTPQNWWEVYTNNKEEAVDDLMESAAQRLIAPALWAQRNGAARQAVQTTGALNHLIRALIKIKKQKPSLRVHVLGHSGGAILVCRFLELATRFKNPITFSNCILVSPACEMGDAASTFQQVLPGNKKNKPLLGPENLHIFLLAQKREESIQELPEYSKSALHFISRVIGPDLNHAILGLEAAWWPIEADDHRAFSPRQRENSKAWTDLLFNKLGLRNDRDRHVSLKVKCSKVVHYYEHTSRVLLGKPQPLSHGRLLYDDRLIRTISKIILNKDSL